MAKWNLPEGKIYTQADLDAAIAAALREAANQTPRHYGVWSATGVHVGVWDDGVDAAKALAEYPGGVMRDLIDVNTILAMTPDAGAALDRALAAARNATLDAASKYLTDTYGIRALSNPIDRSRIAAIRAQGGK